MKFRPHLHIRHVHARDEGEPLFIELWELRRRLITVKPETTMEADYSAFRSFFTGADAQISLICARDGAIQGFLGWHTRLLDVPGGRMVIIDSDYFFVKASLRGHVVMAETALGCFVRSAAHYRQIRVAIVGHGYPSSVLSGARFSSRVRFPQDADVAAWEQEAMSQFCERYCGESFDRERGLVNMRTIPAEPRRTPRSAQAREVFARFESHNPRWPEGWGLPYVIHLSPKSIMHGALRFALG